MLVAEGHLVRSIPVRLSGGPTADLGVCGRLVEVKSFLPVAHRPGGSPTSRSVANKLMSAAGQAPTVVLLGRGSGLTPAVARAGVAEFVARRRWGRIEAVRIVGDGFDLGWTQGMVAVRAPSVSSRSARPARDVPGERPAPGLEW
jgi:hypothetical protein